MVSLRKFRIGAVALRAYLAASSVVVLGACALLPQSSRDPFSEPGATSVQVDVENRNFYDATIYATADGGLERRIGDIVGNGARSYQMALDRTADVRFRIELLADGWCTTPPVVLSPGDVVGIQIVADFPGAANCESRGSGNPGE
jgi:hypothetical protein